ncbi:hypothetical protein MHYP_G00014530 [Metynnis hypsauchen]
MAGGRIKEDGGPLHSKWNGGDIPPPDSRGVLRRSGGVVLGLNLNTAATLAFEVAGRLAGLETAVDLL